MAGQIFYIFYEDGCRIEWPDSFLGLLQTCGDIGVDLRTQVRSRHRAGFESEEEEEPRRAERRGGTMPRRVTRLQSLAAAIGESGRGSSLLIVPGSDLGI